MQQVHSYLCQWMTQIQVEDCVFSILVFNSRKLHPKHQQIRSKHFIHWDSLSHCMQLSIVFVLNDGVNWLLTILIFYFFMRCVFGCYCHPLERRNLFSHLYSMCVCVWFMIKSPKIMCESVLFVFFLANLYGSCFYH